MKTPILLAITLSLSSLTMIGCAAESADDDLQADETAVGHEDSRISWPGTADLTDWSQSGDKDTAPGCVSGRMKIRGKDGSYWRIKNNCKDTLYLSLDIKGGDDKCVETPPGHYARYYTANEARRTYICK